MEPPAGLTCKELVELVTDYLEGALAPEDRSRFEAHLAGCRGCRAHVSQMRRTVRLTGHLTADDLTEASKTRLLRAFRGWTSRPRG